MHIDTGWLLSGLSYIGPRPDLDRLTETGFYKKGTSDLIPATLDIDSSVFRTYKQQYIDFLKDMAVEDKQSFYLKINDLMEGPEDEKILNRFYGVCRILPKAIKEGTGEVVIHGHHYTRKVFDVFKEYESLWPLEGVFAYDMCNLILLLRIGQSKGYIDEEKALVYLEKAIAKIRKKYTTLKTFARDAVICRRIYLAYLEAIESPRKLPDMDKTLVMAYYGLFEYLDLGLIKD